MASHHHHVHDHHCKGCESARAAASHRNCPEYADNKAAYCTACDNKVQHTDHKAVQNAIGASAGSMAVALTLTPCDVVKVRQQTLSSSLEQAPRFASMVREVVSNEGARGLWRGLVPGLTMAVPSTVLYLGAYENLRDRIATQLPSEDAAHAYAPLLAGLSARMMAATVASPVELVRVTLQSAGAGGAGGGAGAAPLTMSSTFASIVRTEGVRGLFRGLGSTLWRDAPFSAVYWGCFEATKTRVRAVLAEQRASSSSSSGTQAGGTAGAATSPPSPPPLPWSATMLSAAASGTVAAVLTNPFDVVKTRQQAMPAAGAAADGAPVTISGILRNTVQQEGVRGLYRGLGVRVANIAPASALFMATYETVKQLDVASFLLEGVS